MTQTFIIKGMACPHCQATVEKALSALDGVEAVSVSLSDGTAIVEGEVATQSIENAIELAGFEFGGKK